MLGIANLKQMLPAVTVELLQNLTLQQLIILSRPLQLV
jgi:hypothetical protein